MRYNIMAPSLLPSPVISVVVPVYNAVRWLPQLVGSLQSQRFADWEAVLVDDGSTDGSAALIEKLAAADRHLRLFVKENGGVSDARNFGLEKVRGEWITFADADDMLLPEAFERLLQCADDTGADIVVGQYHYGTTPPRPAKHRSPIVFGPREAVIASLYQQPMMNSVCGVIFRREIFLPDGPRFRKGKRYEDLEIHTRLFERAARVAFLPEKLYFYRRHDSSFIRTLDKSRFDALDVTDAILARYKGTPAEKAAADRRFSAHFNILLLQLAAGSGDSGVFSRCWNVIKAGRRQALRDPRVRLKNKIGALASFGGLRFLRLLARLSGGK